MLLVGVYKYSLESRDKVFVPFPVHVPPFSLSVWQPDTANWMPCIKLLLPELFAPMKMFKGAKVIVTSSIFLNFFI